MPIPKQRHTSSRRKRRQSQIKLKKVNLSICSHCGKPVLPHTVCSNCGYYKNRQAIDVLARLDKKDKKRKKKELSKQEKDKQMDKPLSIEGLSKK